MYFHEQPLTGGRGYGEQPHAASAGRLGMAVAVPIGVGIAIGEVLQLIALVLAAIAAAFLLLKALEAAQARGIGVAWAVQAVSAGLDRLVSGARRLIEVIRRLIERARRLLNPRPACAAAIADLARVLAEIEQTVAELVAERGRNPPRIPEMRRLMDRLRQQASAARGPIQNLMRACAP